MDLLGFRDYSLWTNIAVFAIAALAVGGAGIKVAAYADEIAIKTGIGHAAIGFVLLGGITSLPEVAVSIFAAIGDAPSLAVNNLLGEVAMQRALLAGVDGFIGREALTVIAASSSVLLQAALATFMLIVVGVAVALGDISFFGAGLWSWSLLALYAFSVWTIFESQARQTWLPHDVQGAQNIRKARSQQQAEGNSPLGERSDASLRPVVVKTVIAAAAILAAGFVLSRAGEAVAEQTGLGLSFVGAVLLSISTSLPELSTVISAVRLRRYEMAIADIFGTSLFNVVLIFLVDAVYAGKPVLNQVGKFSQFAALLGALLSVAYLIGLVERRNRTVGRMGIDSLAILVMYGAGLVVMYRLR